MIFPVPVANNFDMIKRTGVHLKDSTIEFSSRILKISNSLIKFDVVSDILIFGQWSNGLNSMECIDGHRKIIRFNTPLKKLIASGRLKQPSVIRKIIAVISIFVFNFSILFNLFKVKNINYVTVHSPQLFIVSYIYKIFGNVTIFYLPHELEPHKQGLGKVNAFFIRFIESKFIRLTNANVFVVSENIADWYEREYAIRRPVVVKNAPRLIDCIKTNHFRENLGIKDDSVIVLYQGGLTKGRGVDLLLAAFKKRNDDKVVMVFMGYGQFEEEIKIATRESNNIFFHPAVAPDVVLEYTSSADIGVSFIQKTCLSYYYCLPNKLFEYSMAGLPVIVSNMKEMRELVESYNMGIIVEEESVDALNIAIDKILDSDIKQMKQNARRCAEENSWEVQEIKMINEYKRVLNGK
jgi:glycosyltransferase involved in cell wall biosynthesis